MSKAQTRARTVGLTARGALRGALLCGLLASEVCSLSQPRWASARASARVSRAQPAMLREGKAG
jgi:hypothetical protein